MCRGQKIAKVSDLMKSVLPLAIWLLLIVAQLNAQTVITLVKNKLINDGLHIDDDGMMYCGAGGLANRTQVAKITSDGIVTPLDGHFAGSIDVCRVGESLVVSNYDDNTIATYDTTSKTSKTVIEGLDGPAGLAYDGHRLYITEFGAPPRFAGCQIVVSDPKKFGIVSRFRDQRLKRPQGITYLGDSEFVVSNSQGGRLFIWNSKTEELSDLTMLGMNTVNIVCRDSLIYAANNRFHQLTVIDRAGRFMTFAGDGTPATKDGSLKEAKFLTPLGVAFSPDNQFLYVSQSKDGALRKISMPEMPKSLDRMLKAIGFVHSERGIEAPASVNELTFYEMGKPNIAVRKMLVKERFVANNMIPFKDFVVRCMVGKKTYGFRSTNSVIGNRTASDLTVRENREGQAGSLRHGREFEEQVAESRLKIQARDSDLGR